VLTALARITRGRRVLVIASGDLAHVGPAFHGAPLTPATRQQVEQTDQELLHHISAGDADAFFGAIRRVRDRNNVCGVAPIYLTLRALGNVQGERIGYAICPADDQNTSVVTITGVMFY
jgi:hypothetical protein